MLNCLHLVRSYAHNDSATFGHDTRLRLYVESLSICDCVHIHCIPFVPVLIVIHLYPSTYYTLSVSCD